MATFRKVFDETAERAWGTVDHTDVELTGFGLSLSKKFNNPLYEWSEPSRLSKQEFLSSEEPGRRKVIPFLLSHAGGGKGTNQAVPLRRSRRRSVREALILSVGHMTKWVFIYRLVGM
ncbi:hypothetical protein MHYP_G00359770 [Metynnis hypsauchen]